MKERPIIFTPDLAAKVHNGTKTVTRRIVKPKWSGWSPDLSTWTMERATAFDSQYLKVPYDDGTRQRVFCPYGDPTDQLWVRERWWLADMDFSQPPTAYLICWSNASGKPGNDFEAGDVGWRNPPERDRLEWAERYGALEGEGKRATRKRNYWLGANPPIFMPRWACRTVLEIVSVRAERLQEITAEDVGREGVEYAANDPVGNFSSLWERIHGKGAWDTNPWVWRIEFRRANP